MTDVMMVTSAIPFEEEVYLNGLKNREIIINQEIDDSLVERAIMQIIHWNENDKDIPIEDREVIKIYLNTPGGEVSIGLVVANVIKNSKTPVHIIVLANAASMGAIILMAGHKRFIHEFSSVLIHDGYFSISSSSKKAKQTVDYYNKLDERIRNFILNNTNISEELLDERSGDEWWVGAEDIIKYGIADEILR